ncbi:L,D-transpeptidase [Methylocystis sp. B8]|uniref:L,D-transpeptidase n=1 Tax=Methylocystis sp. B8 TaxID=544938 RepID=UPI0010FEA85F|nr:L,D-transpeptidase [Methylocystis sp. B8]TLG76908.1 L,D-transpeptidase [Methylocystis sp. B8]
MRFPVIAPAILVLASVGAANATTHIHINLSTQTMHVQSSSGSYSWPVSTARSGYSTPRGSFAPTGMQAMHYSRKYHMSPMPHSIFFRGGYAIHGSYETGMLGRPASHGCVRLSPGHAAMLYQMVQSEGGSISITGAPPRGHYYASARHEGGGAYAASRGRSTYGRGYAVANPFALLFGGGPF